MVKKTSILDKLKSRWRSPSGMRVERPGTPGGRVGPAPGNRISDAVDKLPATPAPENGSSRKLSAKEEAVMAMGEGFRELSTLVRGVHTRMEGQGERAHALAQEIQRLPALGQAQLELLKQMAAAMERQSQSAERQNQTLERTNQSLERQSQVGQQLLASLGGLPDALKGVQGALERAAATDERTIHTLGEFRDTMDRIQGAMGKMVESTQAQTAAAERLVRHTMEGPQKLVEELRSGRQQEVQALADRLAESRAEDFDRLERTTGGRLDAVRKAQELQAQRLDKLASDGSRWSNVIVVLLALTFFTLAGILGVLILG